MATFRISAHGRLQDWIAAEKGYFDDEGLDYEINVNLLETGGRDRETGGRDRETGGRDRETGGRDVREGRGTADQDREQGGRSNIRTGAYELYRSGGAGKKDMSCACHWAVNQAASDNAGTMWGRAYAILQSAVYVRPGSAIVRPEDLAGVEIAVGFHSGSHFSTIQALEAFVEPAEIKLAFGGMPYDRVDSLLSGNAEAAAMWSVPGYIVEQLGCPKILDSTFMAGFMFEAGTDPDDVERYFRAMRRAQMDLDLAPERYKHHYLKELPARFEDKVDVRRFGPGERIVFLPYTADMYESSQAWMRERGLFPESGTVPDYRAAVLA